MVFWDFNKSQIDEMKKLWGRDEIFSIKDMLGHLKRTSNPEYVGKLDKYREEIENLFTILTR